MNINTFIKQLESIEWFEHKELPQVEYHQIFSVFEAYDTYNQEMLQTWTVEIEKLEQKVLQHWTDPEIDQIFKQVSSFLDSVLWQKWSNFISKNHLEEQSGLEAEILDMVKRDICWYYFEQVLKISGFFSILYQVYRSGYFPCSWQGEFPKGKVVVL